MTEEEFQEIQLKLAGVRGTLQAVGFMVSLPRFSDEERARHEKFVVDQIAVLEAVGDRLREIENSNRDEKEIF
jgi:hypothetical protein